MFYECLCVGLNVVCEHWVRNKWCVLNDIVYIEFEMSIFIKYSKVSKDNGINKKKHTTNTQTHTHDILNIHEINKPAEIQKCLRIFWHYTKSNRNT